MLPSQEDPTLNLYITLCISKLHRKKENKIVAHFKQEFNTEVKLPFRLNIFQYILLG